jgi:hypothetical protein
MHANLSKAPSYETLDPDQSPERLRTFIVPYKPNYLSLAMQKLSCQPPQLKGVRDLSTAAQYPSHEQADMESLVGPLGSLTVHLIRQLQRGPDPILARPAILDLGSLCRTLMHVQRV